VKGKEGNSNRPRRSGHKEVKEICRATLNAAGRKGQNFSRKRKETRSAKKRKDETEGGGTKN